MLSAQILNSDAQLNNFIVINSKEFIPGEEFTVITRLTNRELNGLRFIPPSTTIPTFTMTDVDGNSVEKVGTMFTDDRSMISFSISEAESETLQSGNITFELDLLGDGTSIRKGLIQGALIKSVEGEC